MKSSLCLVIQNRLLDGWEEGKLNPTKRDIPKNSGLQSSFLNGWPNNGVTPSSQHHHYRRHLRQHKELQYCMQLLLKLPSPICEIEEKSKR